MDHPAAGQGQAGLDGVELAIGFGQRAGVAGEDRLLVEQPGPLDAVVSSRH